MTIEPFDLDAATADRVVALADPAFRTESITRLTGGANSGVFEARSLQGRSVVVKVYADRFDGKLEKEVFVYECMRRLALVAPAPTILAVDASRERLSHPVLVMTKLEGVPVASLDEGLTQGELLAVNRQIGALLAALHGITFTEFGYLGNDGVVDGRATNVEYMQSQFDGRLREFAERGGDRDLLTGIERYVARREELLITPHAVLCHNDCHYGNVLILREGDGWRISGLVDFENALAADPLLDIAKTHAYARDRRSEATLAALVEGHGHVRANWREAVDLYALFHALELWDWFAYLGVEEPLAALSRDMQALIER